MLAIPRFTQPHVAPAITNIQVRRETSAEFMAALQQRPVEAMQQRLDEGHRPYVAHMNGEPAGWGWVATRTASIGELSTTITLDERSRYLWNFVTLFEYRGRGVYPQLLQHILGIESRHATDFYIAWAPENHASASGIRKAGFTPVAEMSFDQGGAPALHVLDDSVRNSLAEMLALPLLDEPLTPCWKCVRAGRGAMSCAPGHCRCDYQRAHQECAA